MTQKVYLKKAQWMAKTPLAPSLNVTFFLNKLFLPIPQQKHFEYFFSVNLFCLLNICDGQFGGPVLILAVLNFYGGSIRRPYLLIQLTFLHLGGEQTKHPVCTIFIIFNHLSFKLSWLYEICPKWIDVMSASNTIWVGLKDNSYKRVDLERSPREQRVFTGSVRVKLKPTLMFLLEFVIIIVLITNCSGL